MLTAMEILVLVAGTNDPSNADCLADAFVHGMEEGRSLHVRKIRIRDLQLQHFTLELYKEGADQGPDLRRIEELAMHADAIVVSSPVWNYSVPAHLKNLIDRMGSFALDRETRTKGQLRSTPCFFLFTGGAPVVAWKGLMRFTTHHVREAFRYFGGTIVGSHYVGKCMVGRGTFGCVLNERPDVIVATKKRGRAFVRVVERFRETRVLPLRFRIFNAAYTLGQRIIAKF